MQRQELGLTRQKLVQLLGQRWTAGDIHRLETSRIIMPSWIRVQTLASALGLSLDILLSGVNEPESSQM